MKKHLVLVVGVLLFGFFLKVDVKAQTAVSPAVQAILFYSPTCPHCHIVINDLLVPMQEQYGDQLQILGVDVTTPGGSLLFVETLNFFGLPPDQTGVPTLIVADTVLNGSLKIPEKFPGIVEEGLAAGGIGWPDIPGLQEMVPDLPLSAAPFQRRGAQIQHRATGFFQVGPRQGQRLPHKLMHPLRFGSGFQQGIGRFELEGYGR